MCVGLVVVGGGAVGVGVPGERNVEQNNVTDL